MGNNIGGRKKAKVMKIDGETFKLKTPATAYDVVKDYPGHVLLESAAVGKFGIRAKPLEPEQQLKPKKIYFLVELPKPPEEDNRPMSVRSEASLIGSMGSGRVQIKIKLPRAQVAKLVEESRDEAEMAERIIDLCIKNKGHVSGL